MIKFIQAIPDLIRLLNLIGDLCVRLLAWAEANNIEGWLKEVESGVDQLEKAKSSDEKLAAARNLNDLIRKL